jgi:hypothetical protein
MDGKSQPPSTQAAQKNSRRQLLHHVKSVIAFSK